MLGGRAAAAAHDAHAVFADERGERLGQAVGREVVDGLPVLDARQPRVGRAEQREGRVFGEEAQRLVHQLGAGRAVQPHARQPQRREGGQRRADLAADQHLPGRLDRDCGEDRRVQPALRQRIAAGQDRRLALQQVVDGLDQQRVHPAVEQPARLREVGRVQRVEIDLPQAGQLGAGPERADREARRGGFAEPVGRRAGMLCRGLVDLVGLLFQPILRERHRRRPEGVGQHSVCARLEIAGVQIPHCLRAAEVEHLVAALQPVKVGERQIHRLNAGARRPIEDDRSLRGNVEQSRLRHAPNPTDPRAASKLATVAACSHQIRRPRAKDPRQQISVIPALAAGISLSSCAAAGGVRDLAAGFGLFSIWSGGWAWSGLVDFGKWLCVSGCGWMVVGPP